MPIGPGFAPIASRRNREARNGNDLDCTPKGTARLGTAGASTCERKASPSLLAAYKRSPFIPLPQLACPFLRLCEHEGVLNQGEGHPPVGPSDVPLDVTDAELLRSFIDSRDDLAFGRIVARHAAGVRRVAMLETGNASAAEDVTQATFIVLSRRPRPALRSAKRKSSAEAWLHQVTRYASANWRRAEGRRKRREKAVAVKDRTAAPDPSQPTDLAEAVAAALRTLRRRDRRLILLRHVEEKPWSEVAAAVSMSPEAARKATDRASERLRAALKEQGIFAAPSALAAGLHAIGAPASTATAALIPLSSTTISVSELAKGTIAMMNLKSAASVGMMAAALILGGAGAIAVAQDEPEKPASQPAQAVAEPGVLEARLSDGAVVRLKAISDGSGAWWNADGSKPVQRENSVLDLELATDRRIKELMERAGRHEEAKAFPEPAPMVGFLLDLETTREYLGDVRIQPASSFSIATTLPSSECDVAVQYPSADLVVEVAVPAGEPIAEADVQLYGLEAQSAQLDGVRVGLAPLSRTRLGNNDVTATTVIYAGDLTGRVIHAVIVKKDGSRLIGSVTSRSGEGGTHILNFNFGTEEILQPEDGRLHLALMPLEFVRFSNFATAKDQKATPKVEVLSHEQYVALLKEQAANSDCPVPADEGDADPPAESAK